MSRYEHKIETSLEGIAPIQRKERKEKKKNEIEKPLLQSINLVKVVRFLISPKKNKMKIEVNKIMNPAFLLGTAFNIAYWHRNTTGYVHQLMTVITCAVPILDAITGSASLAVAAARPTRSSYTTYKKKAMEANQQTHPC